MKCILLVSLLMTVAIPATAAPFDWKPYAFRRPPELESAPPRHYPVVVVGAGPVGLTLALSLAYRGVRVVLLEAKNAVSAGSRSAGISRRSTQILDRIGAIEPILKRALRRTGAYNRTHWGATEMFRMQFADPPREKHQATVMLQQCWMEQLMVETALESGMIDLRWSSKVASVTDTGEQVRVGVETPEGSYELTTGYLAAADGAHGKVRSALGLRYEGERLPPPFVIIDFEMKSALEGGRGLWFDPPYDPGATTIIHKFPYDIWRLDALVAAHPEPELAATPEKAKQRIANHLAMLGIKDDWRFIEASLYRVGTLSLPSYSVGRVFFAGDSAHQIPIWSGRGMNHGIEDAQTLAWRLARVILGESSPALLEGYSLERRAAIQSTLHHLVRTTNYMTAPTRGARLMRTATLSLARRHAFAQDMFEPRKLKDAPYPLAATPAQAAREAAFGAGPVRGALAPDCRLKTAEGHDVALYDLFGRGFSGLYFGDGSKLPALAQDAFLRIAPGLSVIHIGAPADHGGCIAALDPFGDARTLYGAVPGTFYLVRPDDRIAARWTALDTGELARELTETAMPAQQGNPR